MPRVFLVYTTLNHVTSSNATIPVHWQSHLSVKIFFIRRGPVRSELCKKKKKKRATRTKLMNTISPGEINQGAI